MIQFDWIPWNLRAHHVNAGLICQGVDESIRVRHLASEDGYSREGDQKLMSFSWSLLGALIFCLGFLVPLENFSLNTYGDITFAGKGLQILTYARTHGHWGNDSSLTCHIYCERGHPFIMAISKDPGHSHLLLSVWQWSCHYLFLWQSGWDSSTQPSACEASMMMSN